VAHQQQAAIFPAPAAITAPATAAAGTTPVQLASMQQPAAAASPDTAVSAPAPAAVPVWVFPKDRLEKEFPHIIPTMPITNAIAFDEALLAKGDATRGMQTYSRSTCIGCHVIKGNPMSAGPVGPNLTHIGSRFTIGGGLYPNDAKHLAYWIKSAPHMKPGSIMPTIGKGLTDPIRKNVVTMGGLTDPEIADIVAYLLALK
jgi:cytochrome c oxidase subunit II